jgi:hypothetical protein
MATRIAVVHDDRWFRDLLATALRVQGHIVTVFEDLRMVEAIPPMPDEINVCVVAVAGQVPGVRLVVTAIPEAYRLAGWSAFVPEPVTALRVAAAVCRLLPRAGQLSS